MQHLVSCETEKLTMDYLTIILISVFINTLIGAAIAALLDTKDEDWFKWYKRDPTGGLLNFFILQLWPILAFFMIKHRRNMPD